ncbi:MAG TPA: NAD-binding protein [Streptosporangiaceae bacterium]|nr:NAD-binding protein [Streptosporangiaceae bacterium]
MSRIMIVGSGIVGRATGKGFIEHGNDVTFVDIDDRTISNLIEHGYTAIYPSGTDLTGVDAVFVSVTALTAPDGIDLSHLEQASKSLGTALAECPTRPVIVFRCTLPPGTTRDVLMPLLEETSGKKAGVDFGVCYNPEYLRADCAERDFLQPRLLTIGGDPRNVEFTRRVAGIYAAFGAPIYECGYEEAEFQKYVHNLYNATKISFFNEMRAVALALGLDPRIAFQFTALSAQGMWDSLYGSRDHGPYAGACLPKDVGAWLSFTEKRRLPARLLGAVREVNRACGGN